MSNWGKFIHCFEFLYTLLLSNQIVSIIHIQTLIHFLYILVPGLLNKSEGLSMVYCLGLDFKLLLKSVHSSVLLMFAPDPEIVFTNY